MITKFFFLIIFNETPIFIAIANAAPQIVQLFLNNDKVDLNHKNQEIFLLKISMEFQIFQ